MAKLLVIIAAGGPDADSLTIDDHPRAAIRVLPLRKLRGMTVLSPIAGR